MATAGMQFDYHDCAICGDHQLVEAPDWATGGSDDGTSGPDWACVTCGTAMFIDPRLIWPDQMTRGLDSRAETA